MAGKRAVIVGQGPQVAELIRTWLDLEAGPELAWQTRADDATLERELGLALARTPAGLRVAGRTIAQVDDLAGFEIAIHVEHERVHLQLAGQAAIGFDPAPVLAITPVLQALERGPGLRWVSLSLAQGRSGELAPFGLVEQSAAAIEQALARRLPGLVGRTMVGLVRGPQLGMRIELVALLGGSTTEVVADVIEHLARSSPNELRACSLADSATVLGDARLWIADRSQGVGPLARIVAHLDPEALLASRVWARVASSG
ncbi:hypothetical protein ACNOYE_10300 [Nannocystaceae bacterium ST9]